MYKNRLRIATEGGAITWERGTHKRDGENYVKGRDEKLKLCPECRIVWEHVCSTGHRPAKAEYYPILPRYGKPEEVCPNCKPL